MTLIVLLQQALGLVKHVNFDDPQMRQLADPSLAFFVGPWLLPNLAGQRIALDDFLPRGWLRQLLRQHYRESRGQQADPAASEFGGLEGQFAARGQMTGDG